jgi:hypothetical protein
MHYIVTFFVLSMSLWWLALQEQQPTQDKPVAQEKVTPPNVDFPPHWNEQQRAIVLKAQSKVFNMFPEKTYLRKIPVKVLKLDENIAGFFQPGGVFSAGYIGINENVGYRLEHVVIHEYGHALHFYEYQFSQDACPELSAQNLQFSWLSPADGYVERFAEAFTELVKQTNRNSASALADCLKT